MKSRLIFFAICSIVLSALVSCNSGRKPKNLSEGEIFYSIDYVSYKSSISGEMMPREMVISFKDNRMVSEIKAPIGNIGITSVANPRLGVYDIYVNMLAFRYFYEGSPGNPIPGFSAMDSLTYEDTGREKEICGFRCTEKLVYLEGYEKPFSIWYTDEMGIREPNLMTPFNDIDGVLMSFFYVIGDAELRFTAQEIYIKKIPDRYFERKKNYTPVTASYLDTLIRKMIAF